MCRPASEIESQEELYRVWPNRMCSEPLAGIRLGSLKPPAGLPASGNAGRTTGFGILPMGSKNARIYDSGVIGTDSLSERSSFCGVKLPWPIFEVRKMPSLRNNEFEERVRLWRKKKYDFPCMYRQVQWV